MRPCKQAWPSRLLTGACSSDLAFFSLSITMDSGTDQQVCESTSTYGNAFAKLTESILISRPRPQPLSCNPKPNGFLSSSNKTRKRTANTTARSWTLSCKTFAKRYRETFHLALPQLNKHNHRLYVHTRQTVSRWKLTHCTAKLLRYLNKQTAVVKTMLM